MEAEKAKLPDFDSLWDYDHPGATERSSANFSAALDSLDLPYLSQLLTQIAERGPTTKVQEAHKTLDRVQKPSTKQMTRQESGIYLNEEESTTHPESRTKLDPYSKKR